MEGYHNWRKEERLKKKGNQLFPPKGFMTIDVTTTYLEMTSKDELKPKHTIQSVEIKRVGIPLPELNRFFYITVGNEWYWFDRLGWSYAQWKEWVDRPELQTWVMYMQGTPTGYFELEKQGNLEQQEATVNILFFGLLPQFIGKGLGGHFLSVAVEKAWGFGAKRVTLNTCTLDHKNALANYVARGFKIYKQKTEVRTLPDVKPELWAGAGQMSK
jgi:GNAT superfamily N-acetyltransferase